LLGKRKKSCLDGHGKIQGEHHDGLRAAQPIVFAKKKRNDSITKAFFFFFPSRNNRADKLTIQLPSLWQHLQMNHDDRTIYLFVDIFLFLVQQVCFLL
jgi:hypothetical protein